jgi:hypothetical protein
MTFATAEELQEMYPQEAASNVDIDVDEDVIKLLAEIGLSAAIRGCGDAARPIFDALTLLRPDNPLAVIGKALGEISDNRPEDAISILRTAGVNNEGAPDEMRAIYLLALCLAGHQIDASLLCRRLLDGGRGPSQQIARRLKPVIDAGLPKPASQDG